MNIKDWWNNVGISFEQYVLDIYIWNSEEGHFNCLNIEKAWAIRLFINLL